MPSYSGTADTSSKAKALMAVVAVHAALGAAILTGLNVDVVERVVDRLQTIDILLPPPPPKPPPPPAPELKKVRLEEGAAGKKADPSPIVAPKPRIPVQSPLPAAPVAGTGSATTSGAATAGTGTGAGGSGAGRGGGGTDYSHFTPARLVRNLSRRHYRQLAAFNMPNGVVNTHIVISATGVVRQCRIVRSSGDRSVDSSVCQLISRELRFRPATDASGQAIEFNTQYLARWNLN